MLNRLDLRGVSGDLRSVLPRPDVAGDEPVAAVREVLEAVRGEGDAAVRRFTERWDGVALDALRVPADELKAARGRIPTAVRDALEAANDAVRTYHEGQRIKISRYVVLPKVQHQVLMSVPAKDGVTELRYERPWYERASSWLSLLAWMSVVAAAFVISDRRGEAKK